MRRLRELARRSRALVIATLMARNLRLGIALRLRPAKPVLLGARNRGFSLEQSLACVDWVFADYERRGLDAERIHGARILELGPGDTLGVALRLIGAGARQVVCLDRFATVRDPEQQRRIHRALSESRPRSERERLGRALSPDGALAEGQDALVLIEGTGVERAQEAVAGRFDAIISRAVLGHLWDLAPAFEQMDRLLEPGGAMLHKIDLSDHGLFERSGRGPLELLTVSDRVWDAMRRHTGLTNRCLSDSYREHASALGYSAELHPTRLIGDAGDLEGGALRRAGRAGGRRRRARDRAHASAAAVAVSRALRRRPGGRWVFMVASKPGSPAAPGGRRAGSR
ncbi:MAG: class I SAM-dependent methyltransferase [Actinobacteria bacterium]|nr:class I SAM-dependent methyltransferase [Actinomycetota bacterium]